MAPQLLIVMLSGPRQFLLNVITFTFGIISSTIVIAVLIALGIMCTNRLLTVRWYGRSVQRIIIGAAIAFTALTLLR
jgi:type IV secretory pathway VirB2 component (pilin)